MSKEKTVKTVMENFGKDTKDTDVIDIPESAFELASYFQRQLWKIKGRIKKLEEKCRNCAPHCHPPYDPTDWHRSWVAPHRAEVRITAKEVIEFEKEKTKRILDIEDKLQDKLDKINKEIREDNKRMKWKNKYLDAIKESIEKIWEPRSRGEKAKISCPVCDVAAERAIEANYCGFCPIKWFTAFPFCERTPYDSWEDNVNIDSLALIDAAKAEVDFLKKLYYDLLHDNIKDPFIDKK